jgi:hypothetical protein
MTTHRGVLKLLVFLLLAGWAGTLGLGMSYYFRSGLPASPDVKAGRIYPITSSGRTYYLTRQQNITHVASLVLSFVFLAGLVLMRKYVDDPTSLRPGRDILPPPWSTRFRGD